jgi:hypothetical protein
MFFFLYTIHNILLYTFIFVVAGAAKLLMAINLSEAHTKTITRENHMLLSETSSGRRREGKIYGAFFFLSFFNNNNPRLPCLACFTTKQNCVFLVSEKKGKFPFSLWACVCQNENVKSHLHLFSTIFLPPRCYFISVVFLWEANFMLVNFHSNIMCECLPHNLPLIQHRVTFN